MYFWKQGWCKQKGCCTIKIKERLYNGISLPSTASWCGNKHWLLITDDCTDHAWSYFSKGKSEWKDEIMALRKDLKTTEDIDIRYIHYVHSEKWDLQEAMQTGRNGCEFSVHHTQDSTTRWSGKMDVCYAVQSSTAHS